MEMVQLLPIVEYPKLNNRCAAYIKVITNAILSLRQKVKGHDVNNLTRTTLVHKSDWVRTCHNAL